MNEIEFRTWLSNEGFSTKMQGDFISRIKKVERAFGNCDIDEEYNKDSCLFLISAFRKRGINPEMERFGETDLPIGKCHLGCYKYAVKKYITYRNFISTSE